MNVIKKPLMLGPLFLLFFIEILHYRIKLNIRQAFQIIQIIGIFLIPISRIWIGYLCNACNTFCQTGAFEVGQIIIHFHIRITFLFDRYWSHLFRLSSLKLQRSTHQFSQQKFVNLHIKFITFSSFIAQNHHTIGRYFYKVLIK